MRYLLIPAALFAIACGVRVHEPAVRSDPPAAPVRDTLKVHMHSGELYLLRYWAVDSAARRLTGIGTHYTVTRDGAGTPVHDVGIPFDSVALYETNTAGAAYGLGLQGIGALTMLGTYVSAVCLADPKSCFGSCPTFYMEGDSRNLVHAEGFSSSVASVLEERDVDALPRAQVTGRRVAIRMKNEAWETHVVRRVDLLVAPRGVPGARALASATDSLFYAARAITSPTRCSGPDGDCRDVVGQLDGRERRSLADSTDLAEREIVELTFDDAPARAGLVLSARNSLITTFLFYQSMAYVGRGMGQTVAMMERGGRDFARSYFGMERLLGAIDVEVLVEGEWQPAGSFGEAGPIAADTKVVPLPGHGGGPLTVRLRMAKGHWRVDWVALASIGDPVGVTRVSPTFVERNGTRDDDARAALLDSARTVVSMPGDEYRLVYDLPAPAETLELFLESQGYYYEWQREQWLAEENAMMAAMVLLDPARALRVLAPEYKKREGSMETLFWRSRFNRRDALSAGGRDARR